MDVYIKEGRSITHLSVGGDWKPGDQPPKGYNDWHEWANVQHKAGLRQLWCGSCGKWLFPQVECGHDKSKRLNQEQFNREEKEAEAFNRKLRIRQLKQELKDLEGR